ATGHVFHDDLGLAGDMLAKEIRSKARVKVVAASRAKADIEGDSLAGIEWRGVLSGDLPRRHGQDPGQCRRSQNAATPAASRFEFSHVLSSLSIFCPGAVTLG